MTTTATTITAPDGAAATIQSIGAQLTSWTPAGAADQLFVASNSRLGAQAVHGGVPVMFPQFANLGPLPLHGFARDLPWTAAGSVAAGGVGTGTFMLDQPDGWGARWPHGYRLELAVAVGGPSLTVSLTVHNTGTRTWYFTGGLHTYLRVADVGSAQLDGLEGRGYRDKTQGGLDCTQPDQALVVAGEVDRVYLGSARPLVLREPGREITISTTGFPDTVVWNPWDGAEQRIADFGPGDYRHMLCVEAVTIGMPPTVEPGQHWRGTQTLTWKAV